MYLYHILILTVSIVTFTLADDSWTHGVPVNGVICSITKEAPHILDDSTLTNTIAPGASNVHTINTSPYGSQNIFYPLTFDETSVGTDPDGHT